MPYTKSPRPYKHEYEMQQASEIEMLAKRFNEGWHEGIKIDALDIELLLDVAAVLRERLAQPEPPQRTWQGLTDDEIRPLCDENHIIFGAYTVDFIRSIEAKLKEKNT